MSKIKQFGTLVAGCAVSLLIVATLLSAWIMVPLLVIKEVMGG